MRIVTVKTNGKAVVTGKLMRRMVDLYYKDMLPWAHLSTVEAFDTIKALPFRPDPPDRETLMRPAYTMSMTGYGGDCDDKCIAFASYCKLHNVPVRFVAVRRADMPTLHHVFCEIYLNNEWVNADPTYAFNTLGRQREAYAQRALI